MSSSTTEDPSTGTVGTLWPPPHRRYLVTRGDVTVTATPCYGLHQPWWVVMTLAGEVDPVPMQDGDVWTVLRGR